MTGGFPEVPEQPTTPWLEAADKTTCEECGGSAYKTNPSDGVEFILCRSCHPSSLYPYTDYGTAWDEVRDWVLDRDEHGCLNCGGTGELHVHHIVKFASFETTIEAHTPENLITLCEACHDELERDVQRCRQLLNDPPD